MKITFKKTPEQIELVKAMASRNRDTAYEAQAAIAEFIGPVLAEVIAQAPTLSNFFETITFEADENPSIPLDLYYDITDEDYIKIYTNNVAGGLPSNTVVPTQSEMKFTTYRLDTAVDFDNKYVARSRMDVVAKAFARIAQELLVKQDKSAASMVLGTLADAETNGLKHVISSNSHNRLILDDLNKLMTRAKRINTSWIGGTPAESRRGITDIVVSPEIVESLRSMAYNPINTVAADGAAPVNTEDGIPATDELRNQIYNGAGLPSFYGVNIIEMFEFGVGQKYNELYAALGGTSLAGGGGDASFVAADDEIILGLDRTRDSMYRAVALDADNGSELTLLPDDQYSIRQQKVGFYGAIEEGRMVLDSRAVFGIAV